MELGTRFVNIIIKIICIEALIRRVITGLKRDSILQVQIDINFLVNFHSIKYLHRLQIEYDSR